jgi:hypothetical protein
MVSTIRIKLPTDLSTLSLSSTQLHFFLILNWLLKMATRITSHTGYHYLKAPKYGGLRCYGEIDNLWWSLLRHTQCRFLKS